MNGSGSITYIGETGGADLSKVDVGTSFSSSSTFSGTLEDGVAYTVAAGVTFTITAAKATGKNISGSGTIKVTELENAETVKRVKYKILNRDRELFLGIIFQIFWIKYSKES